MTVGENTEYSQTENIVRQGRMPPLTAVVKKLRTHSESGDGVRFSADVEYVSREASSDDNVPIGFPGAEFVNLPDEGDEVLVLFLAGDGEAPVIVAKFYAEEEETVPVVHPGEFRLRRLGNALLSFESNDSDETVVKLGGSPDRGAKIETGLTMNLATGAFSIRDGSGGGVSSDGSGTLDIQGYTPPGGGGGGGGGGGTFPSIPTGGAGGDGTGIGQPGFNITNTIDAVDNLGLDPNGSTPINDKIESLSDGTEVVFPPGNYKVRAGSGNDGTYLGGNDKWLHGKAGQDRNETNFQLPDGRAGTAFTFGGSNIGISNATFDHSNHSASLIHLQIDGNAGDLYFYNIQHKGKNKPQQSLGDPYVSEIRSGNTGAMGWSFGHGSGATVHVENYKWTDPEVPVPPYPKGVIGMQAPVGMDGAIDLVNNHMAWRGEHNVYASRCSGAVRVSGGYYHNTANTNMRIEGSNSYLEDATIHVDMQRQRLPSDGKAVRGLRWENPKSTASDGGRVTNVDFVHTTQIPDGDSTLLDATNDTSGLLVENTRFLHDDNTSELAVVDIPGVVFRGCAFTGESSNEVINGNGDTDVLDCCLSMPNAAGFSGCNVRGLTRGGCDRATT